MSTDHLIDNLRRATVQDSDREALGNVTQVYTDDTGHPSYVEISYGVIGLGNSLVPLDGSHLNGEDLVLAFPKDLIKDAPHHEPGKELTREREEEILRHYGLDSAVSGAGGAHPNHGDDRRARVGDSRTDRLRDPHGLGQLDDDGVAGSFGEVDPEDDAGPVR
ncbi:PRC-barrel domain-containing protein [Corynebacterium halotolerans]|uniref:PRC-barrel domain-containing protein n=1 Tax=Corynebacterium halotolerans YIM 70093 = DSM 44683 TaxID=1121362 RepID=M1NPZ2_9CORY|nr:PRC-barrel domain-containing protein [Corynebacterium halotolerans]AGF71557.1 hypothetical protein A605_02715 [Corynebacterium halotolerans YIM 70093 = DSM 44683]